MTAAAQRRREREIPRAWRLTQPSTQDTSDMTSTPTAHVAADPARRQGWTDRAACRDYNPEWWFPISSGLRGREEAERAKAICATCPVLQPCLTWALTALSDGVAGGMTEDERRNYKRRGCRASRGAA